MTKKIPHAGKLNQEVKNFESAALRLGITMKPDWYEHTSTYDLLTMIMTAVADIEDELRECIQDK